jgi:hypothetical protein
MRCRANRRRMNTATSFAGPGLVRLGQVAGWLSVIDVACNRCHRERGQLHTAPLVAQHGADMPLPMLLRILTLDCPRARQTRDACGMHLPQLSKMRV